MKRRLLIDGDIVAYKASTMAEHSIKWEDSTVWTLHADENHGKYLALSEIEDLKDIWYNQQGGKCFWLGIPLEPEWVNESYHPLALSVDRLECGGDYVKDNIVICSRLANMGRSKYDKEKFSDVIGYLKANLYIL